MKLISFVFGVLEEVTPMDPKERGNLHAEIEADINNVVIDPDHELYKPTMKAKVLQFFQNPWVRLGLACSFVFVVKYLRDYMNGVHDEKTTNEED